MREVIVGSRDSLLAVAQTDIVVNYINEKCPDVAAKMLTMKTTGDKILDRTLDKAGGKGLFVKELDRALLEGRTQLSVHSLKDLPVEIDRDLPVLGYLASESPVDVLVLPKDKKEIDDTLKMIYERFPRLEERKNQPAGTLSGGEQQMLAMGRALMSKPRIILMDEPSMGLSPIFVNEIFDIIKQVSASGTTVLLVEQNAKKALSIADRGYVLETGKIVKEGKASDLLNDEAVKKAYLGE